MDFKEIEKKIKDFSNCNDEYKQLFFSNALAGEVGEYCNLVKKKYRDKAYYPKEIKSELSDIFIYLILNARHFNINLEKAILEKIKIVNNEV